MQTDDEIPVYVVKEIANGNMKTCHRNQLLPLFQCTDLVKPTEQRYEVTPKVDSDICHFEELYDGIFPHDIESKDSNNEIVMVPWHDTYVDSWRSNNEDQVTTTEKNLMHSDTHTKNENYLTSDVLTDDNDTTNSDSLDNVSQLKIYTRAEVEDTAYHLIVIHQVTVLHILTMCVNLFYSILLCYV